MLVEMLFMFGITALIIAVLWTLLYFYDFTPPEPPTNLSYQIKGVFMKVAEVRLFWVPSVSPDVKTQKLTVLTYKGDETEGVEKVYDFPATVSEVTFKVPEGGHVHAVLVANDGKYDSLPAPYEFSIGDLTAPLAPEFVSHEVLRVFDDVEGPSALKKAVK
jgi:hypothetical protein